MNTYNVEIVETRRFAVILEAENVEQAQELAQGGRTGEALPLGAESVQVVRIARSEQPRGGGNG